MIVLTFNCSNCDSPIPGEYEEEDLEYPVYCPVCGRQNRIPATTSPISTSPTTEIASESAPAVEQSPFKTAPTSSQSQTPVVVPVAQNPGVISKSEPTPVSAKVPTQVAQSSVTTARAAASPAAHKPAAPATTTATPQPKPAAPARSRIAWRFRPPTASRSTVPLRNCVAIDHKCRVIAALGSDVFALVAGPTGCEVDWKFTAADRIPGSPVVASDGSVLFHSSDGLLHALDQKGAPTRTPINVGPALGWATPLVDQSQRVWICASTGGLTVVDVDGQTKRPFFRHPSRFDCIGALRGAVLYIGCEDQFLHSVDLEGKKGRDRWSQPDKVGLTGWYINSAIALDGSRVIAASRDGNMYCFEENGSLAWKAQLNGRAIGSPIVGHNGMILIGLTTISDNSDSLGGQLVAFHGKTGQVAWSVEFDAPVESTPVAGDNGEIYLGDNSGRVHGVNGQGQRIWSEPVGSAVRSAGSFAAKGQIVFGLDDGSLVAIKCSSESLGGPWPKLLAAPDNSRLMNLSSPSTI